LVHQLLVKIKISSYLKSGSI